MDKKIDDNGSNKMEENRRKFNWDNHPTYLVKVCSINENDDEDDGVLTVLLVNVFVEYE